MTNDDKLEIEISKCWAKLFSIESKIIDLAGTVSDLESRLVFLERIPIFSYTKEESDAIFMSKMQAEQMEKRLDTRRARS